MDDAQDERERTGMLSVGTRSELERASSNSLSFAALIAGTGVLSLGLGIAGFVVGGYLMLKPSRP